MIRTSTRNVWTPPSRSNSRSCSTRSSFGCSSSGNSPISSRNSVPLSASSMRPTFWLTAPVNAPFSCPKSSLSNNPAGTAAQLSLINVLSRRELSACTERATSSFPVPVSPNSKTVESVGANHPHVFQHFEQRRTLPNDFFKPKLRLNFTFQIRLFLRQLVPGVLQPIGHLPKLRDVRGSACNSNNLSGFIEQRLNRDIERVAPAVVRDRHFLSHCYPCFKNPPFEFSQACGLLRPENFCIRFADCLVLPIELRVVNPGVAQLAVLIENRNGRILESPPNPFFVPAHRSPACLRSLMSRRIPCNRPSGSCFPQTSPGNTDPSLRRNFHSLRAMAPPAKRATSGAIRGLSSASTMSGMESCSISSRAYPNISAPAEFTSLYFPCASAMKIPSDACSTRSRKCVSLACSASSARLRLVMSIDVACTSRVPLSPSASIAVLNKTHTGVPSFRRSCISWLESAPSRFSSPSLGSRSAKLT